MSVQDSFETFNSRHDDTNQSASSLRDEAQQLLEIPLNQATAAVADEKKPAAKSERDSVLSTGIHTFGDAFGVQVAAPDEDKDAQKMEVGRGSGPAATPLLHVAFRKDAATEAFAQGLNEFGKAFIPTENTANEDKQDAQRQAPSKHGDAIDGSGDLDRAIKTIGKAPAQDVEPPPSTGALDLEKITAAGVGLGATKLIPSSREVKDFAENLITKVGAALVSDVKPVEPLPLKSIEEHRIHPTGGEVAGLYITKAIEFAATTIRVSQPQYSPATITAIAANVANETKRIATPSTNPTHRKSGDLDSAGPLPTVAHKLTEHLLGTDLENKSGKNNFGQNAIEMTARSVGNVLSASTRESNKSTIDSKGEQSKLSKGDQNAASRGQNEASGKTESTPKSDFRSDFGRVPNDRVANLKDICSVFLANLATTGKPEATRIPTEPTHQANGTKQAPVSPEHNEVSNNRSQTSTERAAVSPDRGSPADRNQPTERNVSANRNPSPERGSSPESAPSATRNSPTERSSSTDRTPSSDRGSSKEFSSSNNRNSSAERIQSTEPGFSRNRNSQADSSTVSQRGVANDRSGVNDRSAATDRTAAAERTPAAERSLTAERTAVDRSATAERIHLAELRGTVERTARADRVQPQIGNSAESKSQKAGSSIQPEEKSAGAAGQTDKQKQPAASVDNSSPSDNHRTGEIDNSTKTKDHGTESKTETRTETKDGTEDQQSTGIVLPWSFFEQDVREQEEPNEKEKSTKAPTKDERLNTARSKYVVRDKDTLEKIAQKQLGDVRFASLILTINRATILMLIEGQHQTPDLRVGQVLWLPSEAEQTTHRKNTFAKQTDKNSVKSEPASRRRSLEENSISSADIAASKESSTEKASPEAVKTLFHKLEAIIASAGRRSVPLSQLDSIMQRELLFERLDLGSNTIELLIENDMLAADADKQAIGDLNDRLSSEALPTTILDEKLTETVKDKSQAETSTNALIERLSNVCRITTSPNTDIEHGFTCFLQVRASGKWETVAAYEYRHGHGYRYNFYASRPEAPFMLNLPLSVVQEMAAEDFKRNWSEYCREYAEWHQDEGIWFSV